MMKTFIKEISRIKNSIRVLDFKSIANYRTDEGDSQQIIPRQIDQLCM